MKRRFMLLVCGFLMLTLLLPFQAAAAEADSAVEAESSNSGVTMVAAGRSYSRSKSRTEPYGRGETMNGQLGTEVR